MPSSCFCCVPVSKQKSAILARSEMESVILTLLVFVSVYINKRFWAFAAGSTGSLSLRCDIIQNIVLCMRNSFKRRRAVESSEFQAIFTVFFFAVCLFYIILILRHLTWHFSGRIGTSWRGWRWRGSHAVENVRICYFPFLGFCRKTFHAMWNILRGM